MHGTSDPPEGWQVRDRPGPTSRPDTWRGFSGGGAGGGIAAAFGDPRIDRATERPSELLVGGHGDRRQPRLLGKLARRQKQPRLPDPRLALEGDPDQPIHSRRAISCSMAASSAGRPTTSPVTLPTCRAIGENDWSTGARAASRGGLPESDVVSLDLRCSRLLDVHSKSSWQECDTAPYALCGTPGRNNRIGRRVQERCSPFSGG